MAKYQDLEWPQGEDLILTVIYERGDTDETLQGVDLTDSDARMDIRAPDRTLLVTLNSKATDDTDPEEPGNQPDVDHLEITMDAFGHIIIIMNNDYTLPGHPIGDLFVGAQKKIVLDYDLFVKDHGASRHQILKGKILVTRSATLWL